MKHLFLCCMFITPGTMAMTPCPGVYKKLALAKITPELHLKHKLQKLHWDSDAENKKALLNTVINSPALVREQLLQVFYHTRPAHLQKASAANAPLPNSVIEISSRKPLKRKLEFDEETKITQ